MFFISCSDVAGCRDNFVSNSNKRFRNVLYTFDFGYPNASPRRIFCTNKWDQKGSPFFQCSKATTGVDDVVGDVVGGGEGQSCGARVAMMMCMIRANTLLDDCDDDDDGGGSSSGAVCLSAPRINRVYCSDRKK